MRSMKELFCGQSGIVTTEQVEECAEMPLSKETTVKHDVVLQQKGKRISNKRNWVMDASYPSTNKRPFEDHESVLVRK